DGEPIHISGLWALKVGNGGAGGDSDKVYFTAGMFGETHGLFGSLSPVAAGTPEGPAEAQMAMASLDVAQRKLTALPQDIAGNASKDQIRQDRKAFVDSVVNLIQVDHDLDRDIARDGAGAGSPEVTVDQSIDAFFDQLRGSKDDLHL